MPARVNTLAACFALFAVFTAAPTRADEHRPTSAIDRLWIPSFGPAAGLTIQDMDGSVSSTCALGGEAVFQPPPSGNLISAECEGFPAGGQVGALRPSDSGSDLALSPYVGGVFQILSPTLDVLPGAPRVYFSAEAHALFGPDRDVAREGDPGRVQFASTVQPERRPLLTSDGLLQRGSRTTVSIRSLGLGANFGLAWPVDFLGRRLWIKPGAGWYRYGVDVDVQVAGGFKRQCVSEPLPADASCRNFREIQLGGSGSETFNGIGPALELDLETGRFGPIGTTLFLGFYGYRVLGNRTLEFADSQLYIPGADPSAPICSQAGTVCGPPDAVGDASDLGLGRADVYRAIWQYQAKPWIFRTGLGFRFHWVGFAN